VSRTRHEVTPCSLYILQQKAYKEHIESFLASAEVIKMLGFKQWVIKQTNDCPGTLLSIVKFLLGLFVRGTFMLRH
jgi:hypothetical protein